MHNAANRSVIIISGLLTLLFLIGATLALGLRNGWVQLAPDAPTTDAVTTPVQPDAAAGSLVAVSARGAHRSVRRRLLAVLLTIVSAAWVVTAALSFVDARHEVSEVLDAHLAQTAALVMVQWDGDGDEIDTEHAPVLHRYSRRVMFQVWEDGDVLRLHSQNAPNTPLSRVRQGFSETTIGESRWRVFSRWDTRDRVLVQVAEQFYDRDELATAVARNFVLPRWSRT